MSDLFNEKILIAMSGGVDSTVAAHLLLKQGYDVSGITMQLWSETEKIPDDPSPSILDQNCQDAKKAADTLGIDHYSVSLGKTFYDKVIENFISEYLNGKTPNPCVFCNKYIKFGALLAKANELGFDKIATGHYARIEKDTNGNYLLKKAVDTAKDQSYFLWSLNQDILRSVVFPLGNMTKSEIRSIAEENGFESAHRSDSQDICFIPNGDYVSFIQNHSTAESKKGNFIDLNGNTIGQHEGLIRYTIGQRKGLGVAFGKPMFVGAKNVQNNTVTLCEDRELYSSTLTASNINLITCKNISSPIYVEAKVRYRHIPASAIVEQIDNDRIFVKFDQPQRAIASGQSVVLYDGDTVIGGGIID